ncbi:lipopolysaccharide biosynthesis protein [Cellulomonas cellasea]|nr:oligosaccharide flippase family protein [Cellulomonas cellasea]
MSVPGALRSLAHRPDTLLVGSNALGLALGLVSAAVQARILGPEGRGEIAVALVPGTMLGMLLSFGLPDYFGRRAAQGRPLGDAAAAAAGFAVLIGAVCALPYSLFVHGHTDAGSTARLLLVAYALVSPVLVYGYCVTGAVAGADRWRAVAAARFVPQAVTLVGLVVLVGVGPSPLSVGMLLVGTTLLGTLLPGLLARVRPRGRLRREEIRPALAFGLGGWLAGALALLNQRADLLLLTVLASVADLGLYAVATTLAAVLNAIAVSVAMPVRNRVVRGEVALAPAASAVTGAVVLVVAGVVALALPVLVPLVLGDSFLPAQGAMVVLLGAQVPLACIVVLTQCLVAVGKPGAPLLGELAALVTTVALVLAVYPVGGIEGAAASAFAGRVVSLSVLLVLVRRHVTTAPVWRFVVPTRSGVVQMRGAAT